MDQTINAVQARQQFGRILEEVYYRRHNVVIERAGRPMAVLVPIDRYRQWLSEREALFAQIDEVHARTSDVPAAELEADVKEAVKDAKRGERAAGDD